MERVVLVLDVRGRTGEDNPIVHCAQTFLHAKLVHKPADEVGVVTPGIDVPLAPLVPLVPVRLETLRTVSLIRSSPASSSLSGALSLARNMLEAGKKRAKRKIVVVSTFEDGRPGEVEAFRRLLSWGGGVGPPVHIKLVRFDQSDHRSASNGLHSPHWLDITVDGIVGARRGVVECEVYHMPAQLKTCFPVKETKEAHVIYSGTLRLAENVEVAVKIVPKTKREPFMALGNVVGNVVSDVVGNVFDDSFVPSGEFHVSTAEFFRPDDVEQLHPVPIEDRIKGYRFGNVVVPMSQPLVELSKLSPVRGVWLVGFMDRGELCPHLFMGTSKVLYADKNDSASVTALCSLAGAMDKQQQVALLRVVLRAGSVMKLMIAHPVAMNPSYFILKEAPFMEDISAIHCSALPEPEADMVLASREFVRANMLEDAIPDLERIGNPTLHRAVNYFTKCFIQNDHLGPNDEGVGDDEVPPEGDLFLAAFGEEILHIDS